MNDYDKFIYPAISTRLTGARLERECRKRGISVRQLQEILGIGAPQSIYNWYRGKTLPSLDNLLALSRLLGISMESLLVCTPELLYFSRTTAREDVPKRAAVYSCRILRRVG